MPPTLTESQKKSMAILAAIAVAGCGLSIAIGELGDPCIRIWNFILLHTERFAIPPVIFSALSALIQCVILAAFISVCAMFMVWWERKVSAHMQSRMGPMYTGGWHGWAQTIADTIKLLLKEDIIPQQASPWIHRLAPVVAFFPSFLCYAALPFGKNLISVDLDIGVLYIFAISGLSVLGIIMAGWGSGNKFSMMGGIRSAAQSVSYEIPRVLSVVPILLFTGSLKLTSIAEYQSGLMFGFVPRWFIFYPVVGQLAFLIFLTSSVAETNRVPFDLPEAESELVAGFHTEYSGMKFSFFFLAEYTYLFLAAGMGASLFLGGGSGPFLPSWIWFLLKSFALVFLFMWFRWTFPRLRIDRLMEFSWKFLLPWSLINILLSGLFILALG